MEPTIHRPFHNNVFSDLVRHVTEVRRLFDWPGMSYHDSENRWFLRQIPLLQYLHHDPNFVMLATEVFGEAVKPAFTSLAMYGVDGVVPPHRDVAKFVYSVDLVVRQDKAWPVIIADQAFILEAGQAIFYCGARDLHYRESMQINVNRLTFLDLASFQFFPASYMGKAE